MTTWARAEVTRTGHDISLESTDRRLSPGLNLTFPSRLSMWEYWDTDCKLVLSFPMFGSQSLVSEIRKVQCHHHETHNDAIEVLPVLQDSCRDGEKKWLAG